ncbi:MAG: glycoside hydrolase family 16 protein [Vampirovibrionales bacterium]|nr:glycoside hydrolase family 16 protein [Vampirovibrionales bacterium]
MLKRLPIALACLVLVFMSCKGYTDSVSLESLPQNPKAGLRLVLDETFDAKALNKKLFTSGMPWDAPNNPDNGNLNIYQEDALEVDTGTLKLWARKPVTPILHYSGQRFLYSSAMLQTSKHFSLQYGYLEARAKMPSGKGLWGGFWLLPSNPIGKWPPEIDVVEHHGDKPNKAFFSLHFQDASGQVQHDIHEVEVPEILDEYHTYGLLWQPNRIVWYVDGRPVAQSTEGIPQEPMYVLLNLAVGGHWPGSPDSATHFPASMDIDYLRIWQP